MSAAAQASFKLVFLCAVVAWMCHTGRLPPTTSQVLSQVSFNLTLPCLLLVSTTTTLARPGAAAAALVPLVAVLHVLVAAALGRVAAALSQGGSPLPGGGRPTPVAAAIAHSAAAAVGAPAAAAALLPRGDQPPRGTPQLVHLCCTFGNALTLPMLFSAALLGAGSDAAARAAAYIALYHAAWSPLMWTLGYQMVLPPEPAAAAGRTARLAPDWRRRRPAGFWPPVVQWWRMLAGQVGDRDGARQSTWAGAAAAAAQQQQQQQLPQVLLTQQLPQLEGARVPVYAAAQEGYGEWEAHPDETPAEALLRRLLRAAAWLWQRGAAMAAAAQAALGGVVNPPLLAAAAGVALGLSPAGRLLTDSAAAAPASAGGPWDLGLLLGVLRSAWEVLEMVAGAALALQALVLASSLFGAAAGGDAARAARRADAGDGAGAGADADAGSGEGGPASGGRGGERGSIEVVEAEGCVTYVAKRDALAPHDPLVKVPLTLPVAGNADEASASVLAQLWPRGRWEWRSLCAVAAVRFLLLPALSGVALLSLTRACGAPADPACLLVLLLQAAMPPAQGLAVLMQLRPATAGMAPVAARLLLQLYAVAVVPVTLWVAAFAAYSGVPVPGAAGALLSTGAL